MSQQGGRPTGHEDDWWRQLYDDSTDDTGPTAAADSLDDRFASAADTLDGTEGPGAPGTGADGDGPAGDGRGRDEEWFSFGDGPQSSAPGTAVPAPRATGPAAAAPSRPAGGTPSGAPGETPYEPAGGAPSGSAAPPPEKPGGPPPGPTAEPSGESPRGVDRAPGFGPAPGRPWTTAGAGEAPEADRAPAHGVPPSDPGPDWWRRAPQDTVSTTARRPAPFTPGPPPPPEPRTPPAPGPASAAPPVPPPAPPAAPAPGDPIGGAYAGARAPADTTPPDTGLAADTALTADSAPGQPRAAAPARPGSPPRPSAPPPPSSPPPPAPRPSHPRAAPTPAPGEAAPEGPAPVPEQQPPTVAHVGSGPPTYDAEPTALPGADPDETDDLVPDTVLDGARYGACTLRAVSLRGDSPRYRGEPRRDALLTARFGSGEQALVLVAMATGARTAPQAHRAAAEACRWIARAVGRSHVRLVQDIRAGRRGELKAGLHRLTDRSLGRLRATAVERGIDPAEYTADLRCLLLPADPECRVRVFFGVGAGGLFRLRGGAWQDIEPDVPAPAGPGTNARPGTDAGPTAGGAPAPEGDRLTLDLGLPAPPDPYVPASPPEPPRAPFRFRASLARSGDVLLMCTDGLADPLRGEPELAARLAGRWSDAAVPGLAAFLADAQTRVKGYADDRTAVAVWEA
ncbi:protein phosphatase 2C domain-containing protein [Streptomyces sp. NPDC093260]|uniref:protein phosphatase 2C domain-containing protein n=1 Tax=Streptomyces sp. NPDC093260 TaxID=3155073 RepID=UPI00341A9466